MEGHIMTHCHCSEPTLTELMREPIVRAVMDRDAVAESDLRRLFDRVRASYNAPNIKRLSH